MDTGRNDVERQGQDRQAEQDRQPVGSPGGQQRDHDDHRQHQHASDEDRRYGSEGCDPGATRLGPPRTIADPQAAVGKAGARVAGYQGPWVEGIDREVGVAGRGRKDLGQQTGLEVRRLRAELEDGQPERQAQQDGRREGHDAGRQDPDGSVRSALPGQDSGAEAGHASIGGRGRLRRIVHRRLADRPERTTDRDHGEDRDEDPELRFDERGDDREDRGPLRPIPPHLAQAEQEEHDTDRVDLAPDDAVEPADRVDDGDERRREGESRSTAELEEHRPDQPADGEVCQDRRDLDQADADAAQRVPDQAEHP